MSSRIGLASGSAIYVGLGLENGARGCRAVPLTDEVLDDGGVVDERIGITCFEEAHRRIRVGDGVLQRFLPRGGSRRRWCPRW